MENKKVGYLILGMCLVIILIIFLFNTALKEIINSSCTMAGHDNCTMYDTLNKQTYLSFGIVGLLVLVGFVLIFTKPDFKIVIKKTRDGKANRKLDVSELNSEEKRILSLVQENKAIFQADLIEKTGFGKAKITRVLDRLEGKGFVERKRRGMTNIVVLKP